MNPRLQTGQAGRDPAGRDPAAMARVPWSLRWLFLAIGMWSAAIAPFIAVILRSRGLDTVTIGALSAIAALAATILVPAWGHLADVLVGRTRALRLGVAIAAISAVAVLMPLPLPLIALLLASFGVYPVLFTALGDALAVGALPAPERQYGAIRALTSLAFAVAVIAAGFLYDQTGYAAAALVSLVLAAALIVLAGWVPDRTRDPAVRAAGANHGGDEAAGRFGSISRALAVQPRLLNVLAILTLAYTGLMGAMIFVSIRIVELGGRPSDVALSFGIAAFAEIPGLVVAGWLGRKIGLRQLFVLGCLLYGACVVSWGVLPSPVAINVTRLITGLCFGALAATRVVIVARLLPTELQATGQTLGQAASFALGLALGGILGGVAYGAFGPAVMFALAGATAIVGGLGGWFVLGGPVGDRERATVVG